MSTRKVFQRLGQTMVLRAGHVLVSLMLAIATATSTAVISLAQGKPPRDANATAAVAADALSPNRLANIKSWAYQLQNADSSEIARSPYDLIVIDHTKNGDPKRTLRPAELARMKKKPDGGRRIVLAYVSIGEAEDYRFYWDEKWIETATPDVPEPPPLAAPAAGPATPVPKVEAPAPGGVTANPPAEQSAKPDRWVSPTAPAWLGDESETWSGNFAVKYWDRGWQDLIIGSPGSFVERVLALGFDGVYLDRVDAYYEHIDDHPNAAEDMVDFVIRLAEAARKAKPGALVVPQNGEELLTRPAYVAAIDAIAKEDLLYGSPVEGQLNSTAQLSNSLGWLENATVADRPVLVVEYLDQPPVIAVAAADLVVRGFIPYFGRRALDTLAGPWQVAIGNPATAIATSVPGVSQKPQPARDPIKPKTKKKKRT